MTSPLRLSSPKPWLDTQSRFRHRRSRKRRHALLGYTPHRSPPCTAPSCSNCSSNITSCATIKNTNTTQYIPFPNPFLFRLACLPSQIFALGFVSAFDQILEGFDAPSKDDIFSAYLKSLDEDPSRFRNDATRLEGACQEVNGNLDDLLSQENSNSNLLKSSLTGIAENAKNGEFYYTKFFAIGLFRVLELTGDTAPLPPCAASHRVVRV